MNKIKNNIIFIGFDVHVKGLIISLGAQLYNGSQQADRLTIFLVYGYQRRLLNTNISHADNANPTALNESM